MIGTLATPLGGTSLRFLDNTRLSPANSTRFGGRYACKASLHAVFEAEPLVESKIRKPASHYEVLRVKRNATCTEIRTAYRSLAKVYHPDAIDYKQQDDHRSFIDIHKAYTTLSDPAERATYDLNLGRRSGLYAAAGKRRGFSTTRRWETDQCW